MYYQLIMMMRLSHLPCKKVQPRHKLQQLLTLKLRPRSKKFCYQLRRKKMKTKMMSKRKRKKPKLENTQAPRELKLKLMTSSV